MQIVVQLKHRREDVDSQLNCMRKFSGIHIHRKRTEPFFLTMEYNKIAAVLLSVLISSIADRVVLINVLDTF